VQAFLARPASARHCTASARGRVQALIAYRQSRRAEAESTGRDGGAGSDPEVLADIVLGCADTQASAQGVARSGQ